MKASQVNGTEVILNVVFPSGDEAAEVVEPGEQPAQTRREQPLDEMNAVMPWVKLEALMAPYYSKGDMEHRPVGLDIMLRVYFLEHWFAVFDPRSENALHESVVMHSFAATAN